jgi:hypothetical protein
MYLQRPHAQEQKGESPCVSAIGSGASPAGGGLPRFEAIFRRRLRSYVAVFLVIGRSGTCEVILGCDHGSPTI